MIRLAIFASGNGSNAQRIAEYFAGNAGISVSLILTNNADAYVLQRARSLNIPAIVFNRDLFFQTENIPRLLLDYRIDWLILAGFLWLVPKNILNAFPGRIINIHPALLPKFGGKGMYGMKVHQAAVAANETESGITIHFVDEHYDEGKVIFQASCPIDRKDTPESLAEKVHQLEYRWFPEVIEQTVTIYK
jgi:phosphoribosylglycinamide formyltransferase 1